MIVSVISTVIVIYNVADIHNKIKYDKKVESNKQIEKYVIEGEIHNYRASNSLTKALYYLSNNFKQSMGAHYFTGDESKEVLKFFNRLAIDWDYDVITIHDICKEFSEYLMNLYNENEYKKMKGTVSHNYVNDMIESVVKERKKNGYADYNFKWKG